MAQDNATRKQELQEEASELRQINGQIGSRFPPEMVSDPMGPWHFPPSWEQGPPGLGVGKGLGHAVSPSLAGVVGGPSPI